MFQKKKENFFIFIENFHFCSNYILYLLFLKSFYTYFIKQNLPFSVFFHFSTFWSFRFRFLINHLYINIYISSIKPELVLLKVNPLREKQWFWNHCFFKRTANHLFFCSNFILYLFIYKAKFTIFSFFFRFFVFYIIFIFILLFILIDHF